MLPANGVREMCPGGLAASGAFRGLFVVNTPFNQEGEPQAVAAAGGGLDTARGGAPRLSAGLSNLVSNVRR